MKFCGRSYSHNPTSGVPAPHPEGSVTRAAQPVNAEAEQNLTKILNEISFLSPHVEDSNVFALDDPMLFRYQLGADGTHSLQLREGFSGRRGEVPRPHQSCGLQVMCVELLRAGASRPNPYLELADLAPTSVGAGFRFSFG